MTEITEMNQSELLGLLEQRREPLAVFCILPALRDL